MRHLVRGVYHVLVVEERGAQQVAQCVILLVEGEDGRVGLARVLLHGDFGLAVAEEEELEAGETGGREAVVVSHWWVQYRVGLDRGGEYMLQTRGTRTQGIE